MKIALEEGINADSFSLGYLGHYLDNEALLAECGLQSGKTKTEE